MRQYLQENNKLKEQIQDVQEKMKRIQQENKSLMRDNHVITLRLGDAKKTVEALLKSEAHWKKRNLHEVIKNERIIDFNERDQMTFNYLKQYDLFDSASKDRHFVNRISTLSAMIVDELGYGVLPLEFAKPYINNRQLIMLNAGKTYPHALTLAWFPRHQQPQYFSALIKACE